ncbi:MAG: T9SS type A sorting domain-containing protein [Flavobacteriales bacterium]|nr:T9SS type A sorting domain-containing protein [Flavobacteriales bacterium]
MRHIYLFTIGTPFALTTPLVAQTITLYSNAFTSPNMAVTTAACGTDISQQAVNDLWAGTGGGTGGGGNWAQTFTVETLLINGPGNVYTDQAGIGGDYCIGLQTAQQNDKAALTLDSDGLPYVNLTMDISGIEVSGCGAPFGTAAPIFQVTVFDTPSGAFNINSPGMVLDDATLTGGPPSSDPFSFNWTTVGAALDVSASSNGTVTVLIDLQASGYAAFDNLDISADTSPLSISEDSPTSEAMIWLDANGARVGVRSMEPNATWMIRDVHGKTVSHGRSMSDGGLDVSQLPKGAYILSWSGDHGTGHGRFILP